MVDLENFDKGLWLGVDSSKAPFGSAQIMNNMVVSDRGGLSKRPGTELLGTLSTTASGCGGLYNYKKSDGVTEIPMRAYSTYLQFYHPTLLGWYTLDSGYTSGQEFGFKESLINTDNSDYLYWCNRTENYRRWSGFLLETNGALTGGETTITTTSIFTDEVFKTLTSDSSNTTTLVCPADTFATGQWTNYWVKITSGTYSGQIAQITDTSTTSLTIDPAITDLTGAVSFQIRFTDATQTGTIYVNGTSVAYTDIPTEYTFTVVSAPAAADDSPVTIVPTQYKDAPKGNILECHLGRMIVGNVRSGISRDSAGALQGSQSQSSYYVSRLDDPTLFTFAADRAAGEGAIVSVPYGGGNITDIVDQEDSFYVFKKDYIESAAYSQDTVDIIQRVPVKQGVGSIYRTVKGKDDVYFVTNRNEITTIGRAATKDLLPQTSNIGSVINRYLDDIDLSGVRGIEHKDRVYFSYKEDSSDTYKNRVLVYNKGTRSFEGVWFIPAFGFMEYQTNLYYGDSKTPNVYRMLLGTDDVQGDNRFGVSSQWLSNYFNLMASDLELQEVSAYAVEGWIKGETKITFELYNDFATDPALSFDFTGSESDLITQDSFSNYLGATPLGISPESSIGSADENGFRHFKFVVYFPFIHGNHFAIGVKNGGTGQAFDITRISLGIESDKLKEATSIKTI